MVQFKSGTSVLQLHSKDCQRSAQGKGLEGARNLPYWFADILDTRNILLLDSAKNLKYGFNTSRSLLRDNRGYSFNQESKYIKTFYNY